MTSAPRPRVCPGTSWSPERRDFFFEWYEIRYHYCQEGDFIHRPKDRPKDRPKIDLDEDRPGSGADECEGASCNGETVAAARRLEAAKRVGATTTLAAAAGDVADFVKGQGDGFGVDVVIDAAGVSATLALALDIVRPGGQVTKVGWGPQPYGASLDPLVQKGVTLQGSYSHNWPMWERVIGMLASGQIDLDPILGRVAPLTDWKDCFEQMHRGEIVKAVLTP